VVLSRTHRLFAAIDFDATNREAIRREQSRIWRALGEGAQIRWVPPEQIHLTLVFLAAVPEEQMPALANAFHVPIALRAFTMAFGGIGVFLTRGAPRVVWMGAVDGVTEAADVQRIVAARIEELDVPVERRPFSAHVTLGRWRNARRSDTARVRALAGTAAVARLEVREVTLYESRLSSSGSTYLPLARAPLAPAS